MKISSVQEVFEHTKCNEAAEVNRREQEYLYRNGAINYAESSQNWYYTKKLLVVGSPYAQYTAGNGVYYYICTAVNKRKQQRPKGKHVFDNHFKKDEYRTEKQAGKESVKQRFDRNFGKDPGHCVSHKGSGNDPCKVRSRTVNCLYLFRCKAVQLCP